MNKFITRGKEKATIQNIIRHIILISSWYFIRGYEPRNNIAQLSIIKPTLNPFHNTKKNNVNDKYSLKKNPTNTPPAYSVLNPLTNSDSLSTKSTGVRPTSAENTKIATTYHRLMSPTSTISHRIS